MKLKNILIFASVGVVMSVPTLVAAEKVGSGSYATVHPGFDEANRNKVPRGLPQVSGPAAERPIPTNDWWSNVLYENQTGNLFAYPIAMRTKMDGLALAYVPKGPMIDFDPIRVGVGSISSEKTTVSNYSDWTVTMRWGMDEEYFEATAGIGMPFVYFHKKSGQDVKITIHQAFGNVTVKDEMLVVEKGFNGVSFVIYAPAGSQWVAGADNTYTSTLAGKDYWSAAMLPQDTPDAMAAALELKQYAYVFPADTRANYRYDEQRAVVRTDYVVTADVKEGSNDKVLMGLLPHHWAHLSSDSPKPEGLTYRSVRGELRTLAGNTFSTELTFHGILPTLPFVEENRDGFSKDELNRLIAAVDADHGLVDWTDSYNDGQLLNRLVQTARIAKLAGNVDEFGKAFDLIKQRLENWLTYSEGEVAFLFYYHKDWTAMLGYPAGHGQDEYLNDHHFHWGYFIHAAAFIEQFEPGWASKWGDMVNLLVRDAASTDRNDPMFPYIRNFSPFAGHCWANGMAALPQGNDQESTSEAMQFHSSLIHWGSVTGDKAIRDLGIYMYATEQSAIEEYWFDVNERILPADWKYSLVSRVFGNDFDNATFWTSDIAASYGIELYPIHGGSFYLSRNLDYVRKLWHEITENTGILRNEANPNLWHDIMWEYLAFTDADKAIELYKSNPDRSLKFGVSQAQTYHWLYAMSCLGQHDATITADCPTALAFEKDGTMTYVAHNYGKEKRTVTFSDGFKLGVEPGEMATATGESSLPAVQITAPEDGELITIGNSVTVSADASVKKGLISRVEFYDGKTMIGSDDAAPYECEWTPASVGKYALTAKAISSENREKVSKPVNVVVADELSGETYECSQTSTEVVDGSPLTEGYAVSFETVNGNDVRIVAQCFDQKEGLVGILFDRTQGFREYQMNSESNNIFSYTLKSLALGTKIRFAIKSAFAGGLSITKDFEYEVGAPCKSSVVENILGEGDVTVYPNPVAETLHLALPSTSNRVYVWSGDGRLMFDAFLPADAAVDVEGWANGIYFLRVESEAGIYVGKVVKR